MARLSVLTTRLAPLPAPPSVFISGAFGKLTMGDVDGAAQSATGHVSAAGLTGPR